MQRCVLSCSAMSNSLLPTPWTVAHQATCLSGKNTRVGGHFLRQETFPTQGLNPRPCISCIGRWTLCHRATWESPGLQRVQPNTFRGKRKIKDVAGEEVKQEAFNSKSKCGLKALIHFVAFSEGHNSWLDLSSFISLPSKAGQRLDRMKGKVIREKESSGFEVLRVWRNEAWG